MTRTNPLHGWLLLAFSASVRRRALLTSALVGTLLALINHGAELLGGPMSHTAWMQIGLTYLVPYCVATWSSVQTIRHLSLHGSTTIKARDHAAH